VLIALPYAELSCRRPLAGGGYGFVREVLGERAGFVMGWGYWGAYLFLSIFITLGFGGYLESLAGVDQTVGAVALVVGCTALNLLGVRVSGGAQLAVVALAVGGLLAFSAGACRTWRTHSSNPCFRVAWRHWLRPRCSPFWPSAAST